MPGFRGGSSYAAVGMVPGFSMAAVTAGQVLSEITFPWDAGRLSGFDATAVTAGTGGGNGVLDVLINGTSVWTTAGDKPTLAATSTGRFVFGPPNVKGLRYGDRVSVISLSISSTGHARVSATLGLEKA